MFVKIAFYAKWSPNPFDKTVGSHYNYGVKFQNGGEFA